MAGTNGLATVQATAPATATPSPVLVLTVGHSVFRTLLEVAEREGIDVNSLGVSLLMLGLGKQSAFVQARRSRGGADDSPNTLTRVVCINCARPRVEPAARCPTCGGGWCTSFG